MAIKSLSTSDIKKLLQKEKYVIGTEQSIKNLKIGKVKNIIVTKNCPEKVLQDIKYYSDLTKTDIIKANVPNEELGIIAKKPFAISILAVLKGKEK